MRLEEHCAETLSKLGGAFPDIHRYIDRHFDERAQARAECTTDGDFYEQPYYPFAHRVFEHHKEGIALVVAHFKGVYPAEMVRKVATMHIESDYGGIVPSRKDFDDPAFLRRHHQ